MASMDFLEAMLVHRSTPCDNFMYVPFMRQAVSGCAADCSCLCLQSAQGLGPVGGGGQEGGEGGEAGRRSWPAEGASACLKGVCSMSLSLMSNDRLMCIWKA